jgi:hypothetical protein
MKQILNLRPFCAALLVAGAVLLFSHAAFAQSGEVTLGNSTIEPAIDDTTGNPIFFLQPKGAPFPVNANAHAIAPLYAVVYPVQSTIPADSLNCQPTNCDHLNVLPFPDTDYGLATAADCLEFNAGAPCSAVKGHNHLLGIARTGGDFNVAWAVELVLFNSKAFADGTINTKITTLSQLQSLVDRGEVSIVPTPITFNCSIVPQRTYELGTPMEIPVP